jgi:hypothetical protein
VRSAAGAARHHLATGDADVRLQFAAHVAADRRHGLMNVVRRADRAFGVVAVRHRCAEDRHHVVADVLVDVGAVSHDNTVHGLEITVQQAMGFLRAKLVRQLREARQIGEQDSDLPAFARLRGDGRFPDRGFGLGRRELCDGGQQLLAMAKGAHPELLEVLCGQIAQGFRVDVVLAKRLGVLPEAKIVEPSPYIHVGCSPRMFISTDGRTLSRRPGARRLSCTETQILALDLCQARESG